MILENFVVTELKKQQSLADTPVEILHFRTSNDQEVDIVLEMPNGEIVGIEIKSGANVSGRAFKGLKILEESAGKKFKRGILIYAGEKSVAFADNMFAVPIHTMWQ